MKKLVAVLLLILFISVGGWYGVKKAINHSDYLLSKDTVSQRIEQTYGGKIEDFDITEEDGQAFYKLKMLKEHTVYAVLVNGHTGKVLSFKKEEDHEPPASHKEPETPDDSFDSSPNTPITKDEAKKIALKKVNGTITDVDLENDDDELVYEIDIQQTKKKEATVVINAYTGEIEAITFEIDD